MCAEVSPLWTDGEYGVEIGPTLFPGTNRGNSAHVEFTRIRAEIQVILKLGFSIRYLWLLSRLARQFTNVNERAKDMAEMFFGIRCLTKTRY